MLYRPKKRKRLRIKDLPVADRPREKLFARGKENLSDGELVALLLGTGSLRRNALLLAEALLRRYPLKKLSHVAAQSLLAIPGIGKSKGARLIAALELGKRVFLPPSLTRIVLSNIVDVLPHILEFADKKQEYLLVFYLNARDELVQKEIVAVGSLNTTRIAPSDIFRVGVATPCARLILAHNHPSGEPTPSDDDIAFTKRMHEAGEIMGIALFDHLIISERGYFSFRENKVFREKKAEKKRR